MSILIHDVGPLQGSYGRGHFILHRGELDVQLLHYKLKLFHVRENHFVVSSKPLNHIQLFLEVMFSIKYAVELVGRPLTIRDIKPQGHEQNLHARLLEK